MYSPFFECFVVTLFLGLIPEVVEDKTNLLQRITLLDGPAKAISPVCHFKPFTTEHYSPNDRHIYLLVGRVTVGKLMIVLCCL
jgi:hypothetical protein